MEIVILLDIILTVTILNLPKAIIFGTLLSELSVEKKTDKIVLVAMIAFATTVCMMTFDLRDPLFPIINSVILLATFVYLLVCKIFKKKIVFGPILMFTIFFIAGEYLGPLSYEPGLRMITYTGSLYLSMSAIVLSLLAFGLIIFLTMKGSIKYPLMKWIGYLILVVELVLIILGLNHLAPAEFFYSKTSLMLDEVALVLITGIIVYSKWKK